jgi:outer membrane protein OmpA-like peptidoglycan-associated protein
MPPEKLRTFALIIFLPLILGLSGCAVALLGIGAGIGALSYTQGELVKSYRVEYAEAVQASLATLKSLKIHVTAKTADELKTTIKAKRADATPVTVRVVRIDRRVTEIGVRTGDVGLWDQASSRQVHDFIAKRIAPGPAKTEIATQSPPSKKSSALSTRPPAVKDSASDSQLQSAHRTLPAKPASEPAAAQPGKTASKADKPIVRPDFVIYFDPDSNDISDREIEKLNRIAEIVLLNPKTSATIHGYCDLSADPDYNVLVAESRGHAVKAYLIGKGIPSKNLSVVNHGSDHVQVKPPQAQSDLRNSRVEIEIKTF